MPITSNIKFRVSNPHLLNENNCHEFIEDYMLKDILPIVPDFEKSHGCYLVDKKTGSEYLDCFTFFASNPLGYNREELSEKQFERELLKVAKIKPSNSDIWSVEMAQFLQTFIRVAIPKSYKNLFLIDGGALAVENAIKAAVDWKIKRFGDIGEREIDIIHLENSFHGRSGYTLSLTNTADPRKYKGFPSFPWTRLTPPVCNNKTSDDVRIKEDIFFKNLSESLTVSDSRLPCCVVIEPIQGEGGDNHFTTQFHGRLRKICTEKDVLLIYDEVQTGLGLTGKMWAFQHYGIEPDIVCFGKKVQICGVMCTDKIKEVPNNVFEERSRISSTWGGNLVDMVRSKKFLEIIESNNLVVNAKLVGNYIIHELETLQRNHSNIIEGVRGKGLMIAFDVKEPYSRDEIISLLFQNKVIVLPCGRNSIRIRPPLDFSKHCSDIFIKKLTLALTAAAH